MPELLDRALFEPRLNETFLIESTTVELKLVECRRLKSVEGEPREPFSLVFRGPLDPFLQQRTYPIRNEHTGTLEIFLVPVGRDTAGFLYEAVFN
ncbi:MAG: hypothetical protein HY820_40980 [Acidobacteria bacterium]|nr:hypothetical protein [Acidobacteriota bacterium]